MYHRFFSCLHLAVGRHHRRRTSRCPHGLQISRVKVFLTDHMHTNSRIHHKLSSGSLVDAAGKYPFLRGRVECGLVFFWKLVRFFGNVPRLAISWRGELRWWWILTSIFPSGGPFFSPDTRLTQRGLCESYSSSQSQDFLHRVSPAKFSSLRIQCLWILRNTTQLWCTFS